MKFKTTAKAIRENYFKAIAIPYCEAQYLLYFKQPVAYNAGTYGWNFDLYVIDGIAITTGYRNLVGDRVDYDLVKSYEDRAAKILHRGDEDVDQQLNTLLHEFIKEGIA